MNEPYSLGLGNDENLIAQEFSLAHFYIDNPSVVLRIDGTVFLNKEHQPEFFQIDTQTKVQASVNGKPPSDLRYCFFFPDNFEQPQGEDLNRWVEACMVQFQIEVCMHYRENGLLSAAESREFEKWKKKRLLKPENPYSYHHGYLHILYWKTLKVGELIRHRLTCLSPNRIAGH